MNDKNLGSAAVGFEVDLKSLQSQLNQAARMIGSLNKDVEKEGSKAGNKGGILGSIVGNGQQAGMGLSLLGNFSGSLGRLGTAIGGTTRLFGSMGAAAAGAGAAIPLIGVAIVALIAVVGGAILAFKAFKFSIDFAFKSLQAFGNTQAATTSFEVMANNLGLASGQIATFRDELKAMSFTTGQQTEIMGSLVQVLGENGLSKEALEATKAMRDLGAVAGTDTATQIDTLTAALATLNPQLLYGVNETPTQVFEEYGNTIGKTAAQMSVAEKQLAILNKGINLGAQYLGVADASAEDYNRLLTRMGANYESLQAGIGRAFGPVATGILGVINSEILALSGTVDGNKDRFEAVGEMIRDKVVPIFQGLISWIKNLPWNSIVNGAYQTWQVLKIVADTAIYMVKIFVAGLKQTWGVFQVTAGAIGLMLAPILSVGNAASEMWKALTGKQSFNAAISNSQNFSKALNQEYANLMKTGFGNIGGGIKDGVDAGLTYLDNLGKSISNMANGFDLKSWWDGLGQGAETSTKEALDNFKKGAGEMSKEAMKAAKKMAEDLAKENADFARKQATALKDYTDQLADLVASHRDRISDLQKDIKKETKTFEKAQAERARDYQEEMNKLTKADGDRKSDVEKQIAEELAKGRFADQTKLAQLRSRLTYEDAAHKEAVAKAEEKYVQDTANATEQYNERLTEIQKSLDKELAIQAKHAGDFDRFRDHQIADDITKLKEQYATRKAEDERAHQERLADIIKQGTEQAAAAGAQGDNIGKSYGNGYAGGIGASMPNVKSMSNKIGDESGKSTQGGIDGQKNNTSNKYKGMLQFAATVAGGAVGSIFGPVGTLIGGFLGNKLVELGPTIGGALKSMFEKAVDFLRNWDFGKRIIGLMGKAIHNALPFGVSSGFKSAWNAIGLPAYAKGGIVGGRSGVDNNLAAVTKGEMILNRDQQSRMFNMLDGRLAPDSGGSSNSGMIIENLTVSLPSVRNASDFERELQLKFSTMRTV